MSWEDAQLESKLAIALNTFNWSEAEEICSEIIKRVKADTEMISEPAARSLLKNLRRKRRFALIARLSEAFFQSGMRVPQILRQYAQALIDQGNVVTAEFVLQSIIQNPQGIKREELEARGLMGRVYKQTYINNNDPNSARNRANLERALTEYMYVYRLDPEETWHGINVVALVERAKRDGFSAAGLPDSKATAQNVLATLAEQERQGKLTDAFFWATYMEACLALGDYANATSACLRYIHAEGADAFEIYSTFRQLTEVWQLDYANPPGSVLLPILKAGYIDKQGAEIQLDTRTLLAEASVVNKAAIELEANYGSDKIQTLLWYKKGLEQCNSIARVERRNGKGHGTGWLVTASDFFPNRQGVLLLTNHHVVSPTPKHADAILPEDCRINFQALGKVFDVEDQVVWTSKYDDLDATLLALKGEPAATPLRLHKSAVQLTVPPPRMYIMGHPGGRDLEISLQDNHLVACDDTRLHYRTPTERGSSGSPVFEPEDWRVVGLHHAAQDAKKRNEGIAILAIQKKTRAI